MSGFNNIQARSREERRALTDKESWEKARLQQRKEGFIRIDPSVTGSAMTEFDTRAQGYMSDANRFHSDTAGEESIHRLAQRDRERMIIEKKRLDCMQKDEERWQNLEHDRQVEEQKWDRHREEGLKAFSNKSSVPFDPITLGYHSTEAGKKLKQSDENIKFRAELRAKNLYNHSCRGGVNPITGEPLQH